MRHSDHGMAESRSPLRALGAEAQCVEMAFQSPEDWCRTWNVFVASLVHRQLNPRFQLVVCDWVHEREPVWELCTVRVLLIQLP